MDISIDRIDDSCLSHEDKAKIMLEEAYYLHFVLAKEDIDLTTRAYKKVIDNRWELHQGLREALLANQHLELYDVNSDGSQVSEGKLLWKRYFKGYMSLTHVKLWLFDGKLAISIKGVPEDQFVIDEVFEPRRVTVQVDRQTVNICGVDLPRVSRILTFDQDDVSKRPKKKRPCWLHPDLIKKKQA